MLIQPHLEVVTAVILEVGRKFESPALHGDVRPRCVREFKSALRVPNVTISLCFWSPLVATHPLPESLLGFKWYRHRLGPQG